MLGRGRHRFKFSQGQYWQHGASGEGFTSQWKAAVELMHADVITSNNFLCGMEILKASLTRMLLCYTRITECVKKVSDGSSMNKDLVSISSIPYEIKKYSRTL